MKKILNFSMAALVAMGAILAGCSKNELAEPEVKDNIVTVTTTVSLDENAATKALAIDYPNKKLTKTFAVGDQVALVYTNTSDTKVKAVSQALTVGDISADGKSASLTFTLTNPNPNEPVRYFYPASLLGANGIPDLSPLATQDGTLSDVASKDYSLCVADLMPETTLPASVSLTNALAIVAFTLKDATGTNDITSTITGMTISCSTSTYTYTVTRTAADGPIYVIMLPVSSAVSSATIEITATDGTKNYTKTLNGKTFSEGNFYQQGLLMTEVDPNAPLSGIFSISAGQTVQFSKGNLQYQASTGTWRFAEHQYDYVGNAAGNNTSSERETQSDWIDLFGWGTSGKTFASGYGTAYQPWATSTTSNEYGPTDGTSGLTGTYANGDWGVNMGAGWRTLTSDEWTHLLNSRGGTRYCKATVNSKTGLVIFPDSYSHPTGVDAVESANTTNAAYDSNSWSGEDWTKMEAAGAVFLPAACSRYNNMIFTGSGLYWSSTSYQANTAYGLNFTITGMNPTGTTTRCNGGSVRLVQEVVTP